MFGPLAAGVYRTMHLRFELTQSSHNSQAVLAVATVLVMDK